jgi:sRNA-binding protein
MADAAPTTIADLSPAACAARLADLFPAIFSAGSPQPLKLRIQADIQQRAPGIFTKKSLSIFLHRHTTNTAYLRAIVNAPQRIDLDGAPAGEVADEHRQAAVAELDRRRARHDERRAAERAAQRQAVEASRRAREADDVQRRERGVLLRAYETTTLTRANFCALKGLDEAQLDALLGQARLDPRPERIEDRGTERGPRPGSAHPHIRPERNQRPGPPRRPGR